MLDANRWKGKSAGVPLTTFDKHELELGMKDEMEHTDDPRIAVRIAADHLVSDPHYYTKKEKMGLDEQRLREAVRYIIRRELKPKQ